MLPTQYETSGEPLTTRMIRVRWRIKGTFRLETGEICGPWRALRGNMNSLAQRSQRTAKLA